MIKAISLVGQSSGRAGTLMNSSEELIERARHGDDDAFRLIFDRYGRPIISFIYDMVGRRDLAEELAQETFMRAYKISGPCGMTPSSLPGFWNRKNVARESLRYKHRETDKVGIDDDRVIELSDGKLLPDRELLDKN